MMISSITINTGGSFFLEDATPLTEKHKNNDARHTRSLLKQWPMADVLLDIVCVVLHLFQQTTCFT